MMVIHHIAIVKPANGCPKIILDAEMVMDVELQFPGLEAQLALVF
jgi:hypothetical protein